MLRKKIHWVPFTFACVTGGRFVGCFTDLFQEGCNADEKFYAVLARGCLQLHQPLKAEEWDIKGLVAMATRVAMTMWPTCFTV